MLHNSSFKVKIKNTLTGPLKQNIRWAPNSKSSFAEKKEEKISGERKWQKGKIHNKNKNENSSKDAQKIFSCNGYFENWFD